MTSIHGAQFTCVAERANTDAAIPRIVGLDRRPRILLVRLGPSMWEDRVGAFFFFAKPCSCYMRAREESSETPEERMTSASASPLVTAASTPEYTYVKG